MSSPLFAGIAATGALLAAYPAHGHMMQQFPPSRMYSYSRWGGKNGNEFPEIETAPYSFNSGGVKRVQARAYDEVDEIVLEKHGGGEVYPLLYSDFAENGNMLESNEIAKRHFVCGDPRLGHDEEEIKYSTGNSNWEPLTTFVSGQVIEMDVVVVYYHWGHVEFSICDTGDLDYDSPATQECFNRYPLTRASDDGDASPIDPDYPGRYYVEPPCRAEETDQDFDGEHLPEDESYAPYRVKMRYVLPDIDCPHCVLQMHYFTGHRCKHVGYDEFNPSSWPSDCAPNKSDWVVIDREDMETDDDNTTDFDLCGISMSYPEEFWNCADITIESDGGQTPDVEPEAESEPEDEPEPEAYVDLGCFADTKTERIMTMMELTPDQMEELTNESCMEICEDAGYVYSGTQFSIECFCGDDNTDHLHHGESDECTYPCPGNSDEECGGHWCMNVRQHL